MKNNTVKHIIFLCLFCLLAFSSAASFADEAKGDDKAPAKTEKENKQPEAPKQEPRPGHTTILNGKVFSAVTRSEPLPFNAIVEEVLVNPGQSVVENQILLKYSLVDEARRALQKEITLGAGTEGLRREILALESQLAEVAAERNKARKLADAGLGSKQAFKLMEGDVNSIRKRIALLQSNITQREENFAERLEELSDYFGTTIKKGSTLPEQLVLTAPMDGHVLSVGVGLYPGTQFPSGATPIVIGKMDPMLINIQVYEGDMDNLKVGDVAKVTIPSLDDKVFTATVAKIAWTSNDVRVDFPSYFTVELTIPNADLELKPGFKAIVQLGS